MLPFQPVPAVSRALVQFDINGVPSEHRLHFKYGGTTSAAILNSLCIALENWWDVNLKPWQTTHVVFRGVKAVYLGNVGGVFSSSATKAGTTGTDGSDPLASSTSKSVELYTAFSGKSGRGRIAYGGFGEDKNTNGLPTAGLILGVVAATQALIGLSALVSGFTFGIVSYTQLGVRLAAGEFRPVLSCANVSGYWGTQRSRIK